MLHKPVLLSEVIDCLNVDEKGFYVDATFGFGGHSYLIAKKLKKGKIIAFEWDEETVELFKKTFVDSSFFNDASRFELIRANFVHLREELEKRKIKKIDGVLFDLGISSYQLLEMNRGFSYRIESMLDMRVSRSEQSKTAEEVLNTYSEKGLADIFYKYGEEYKSKVIAKKICRLRKKERIINTSQLSRIISSCFSFKRKSKHPAKRVFQALRIFLNEELDNLRNCLNDVLEFIAPGGRIVVITYHSLEDRIVKKIFKEVCGQKKWKILHKKVLVATKEEIKKNRRSRGAKLRVLVRV